MPRSTACGLKRKDSPVKTKPACQSVRAPVVQQHKIWKGWHPWCRPLHADIPRGFARERSILHLVSAASKHSKSPVFRVTGGTILQRTWQRGRTEHLWESKRHAGWFKVLWSGQSRADDTCGSQAAWKAEALAAPPKCLAPTLARAERLHFCTAGAGDRPSCRLWPRRARGLSRPSPVSEAASAAAGQACVLEQCGHFFFWA